MSVIQQVDKNDTGRFDHIRCGTCGVPYELHTAACSRHAYIPPQFRTHRGETKPEAVAAEVARIPARIAVRVVGPEERNGHS